MHDLKNISLAWVSSLTSLFTAVTTRDALSIISAIVLPVVFFTIGKSIDVLIQIYLRKWLGSVPKRTRASAGRQVVVHRSKRRGK